MELIGIRSDVVLTSDRFRLTDLIQLVVFSFVIMALLAFFMSAIITASLNRNIDLLGRHGNAMVAGKEIKHSEPYSIKNLEQNVSDLRWLTYGTIGAASVVLYISFITIVWRGSRTLRQQGQQLELRVQELAALNKMFQRYLEERGDYQFLEEFGRDVFA